MARKIIYCLLCLCFLAACGPPRYEKQTVQQDPLFEENYIVRDQDGQQVGYAVRVSEDEYRFFREDGGKTIILRDPLFEDAYLIFNEKGGD
jgi:hypothetical protein